MENYLNDVAKIPGVLEQNFMKEFLERNHVPQRGLKQKKSTTNIFENTERPSQRSASTTLNGSNSNPGTEGNLLNSSSGASTGSTYGNVQGGNNNNGIPSTQHSNANPNPNLNYPHQSQTNTPYGSEPNTPGVLSEVDTPPRKSSGEGPTTAVGPTEASANIAPPLGEKLGVVRAWATAEIEPNLISSIDRLRFRVEHAGIVTI